MEQLMENQVDEQLYEASTSSGDIPFDVEGLSRDEVQLLTEAIDATRHASHLWLKLLRPYIYWCYRSIYMGMFNMYQFTKRQYLDLDEETQTSILTVIGVLVGILLLKRMIERSKLARRIREKFRFHMKATHTKWLTFHSRIAKTSKLFADSIPHLSFALIFGIYLLLVPSSVRVLIESWPTYFLMAKVLPLVWTISACIEKKGSQNRLLQLWISFYMLEILDEIPFVLSSVNYIAFDFVRTMRLLFCLWVLLPWTDGSTQICSTLAFPKRKTKVI